MVYEFKCKKCDHDFEIKCMVAEYMWLICVS